MSPLSRRLIDTAADAETLVRLLIDAGEELPRRLRERILTFGPAVVPPLIALVEDRELSFEEAPGEGWAPIHAVELLAELKAPAAIEPLLRLFATTERGTIIHDTLLLKLPKFGPAILEPILAAHAAATDPELRSTFCGVLANLGVRDDRIYEALVEDLQHDMVLGAGQLAEYGDPRAVPLLVEALDRYESQGDEPFANQALIELEAAIQELGGEVTPEQKEKIERILAPEMENRRRWAATFDRSARAAGTRPKAARKIGRNDPCPCGSGKKYKKCCLAKEAR